MSWQLRLLNSGLRLFVKPRLAATSAPGPARATLENHMRRMNRRLTGFRKNPARLRVGDHEVPALWVSTEGADRHSVLLYFHGGAYFLGSPATHFGLAGALAAQAGVRALLPKYRLAPEHPFPAAAQDALLAYEALLARGYDPAKIALAGDSAGGGLAFSLLHQIGVAGLPRPACIIGFSPWVDLTLQGPSLRRNTRRDVLLPSNRIRDAVQNYLDGADAHDPRASPIFGGYRDAPPALIQASRSELLESDSEAMAKRLQAFGGDVRLEFWHNTPHAWHLFHPILPEARTALQNAAAFLRSELRPLSAGHPPKSQIKQGH